jgi:formylglycine-generating enzyme required for sulfatase activity
MKRKTLYFLVICVAFSLATMLSTGCGSSSGSSTSSTTTATTTTLKSSTSSTTTGTSITLTATVSPSAATGTVTFYNGTASLGTGTLTSGVATLSTSFSTAATDSITATYDGDSTYAASTSSAISLTVTSSGSSTTTISMIAIPAGTFYDGVSYMTISTSFNMSEYPITQAQYKAVMGTNPSTAASGTSNPVDSVSWYDALVFCNTLSMADGLTPVYSINGSTDPSTWGTVPTSADMTWDEVTMATGANGYRLPTSSEWLWASMGGLKDGISSDIVANSTYGNVNQSGYLKGYAGSTEGNGGQTNIANYCWETDNSGGTTQPVGQKLPNEFGLYDMCGNVSEWTWDYYWGIEQGAQEGGGTASVVVPFPSTPETDYTGLAVGTGKWRWLLGGSYNEGAAGDYVILPQGSLDSSGILHYVDAFNPSNVQATHGFRVVKSGVF